MDENAERMFRNEVVNEVVAYLLTEAGTDDNGGASYDTGSFRDAAEFVSRKYLGRR